MPSLPVAVILQDSCLVTPDTRREHGKVVLSALAHMMWFVPYRTRVLFFKQPALSSFKSIISGLKNSLRKTLVEFYPVAGRLSVRDEDGVMELECNDKGVLFIEALADVELEEFQTENGNFEFPYDLLVELTQTGGHDLQWPWNHDMPLLIVQVTRFSCGGLSLSLMFNHQVLDGTAIWHFVKSWAETSRGESISVLPDHYVDIPVTRPLQEDFHDLPSDLVRYKRSDVLPGGECYERTDTLVCEAFTFKKKMISTLKRDAPGLTTFQLLTEHLWRKITAARQLREEETTRAVFAINCRERLAGLPANFCGQAAMLIGASLKVGELQAEGVNNGGRLLRKRITEFTNEKAESYVKLLSTYGSDGDFAVGAKRAPTHDIIVKGSFYFQVYQDFGFGKAFGMCVNPVLEDGKIYYFPGTELGDAIAYITLQSDAMERLRYDTSLLSA